MKRINFWILIVSLVMPIWAKQAAQEYAKAQHFQDSTKGKVYHQVLGAKWSAKSDLLFYYCELPNDVRQWYKVSRNGQKKIAFDHKRLALVLSRAAKRPISEHKIELDDLEIPDGQTLKFKIDKQPYVLSLQNYTISKGTVSQVVEKKGQARIALSPDGKLEAAIEDNNVLVRQVAEKNVVLRSHDGNYADAYSGELYWSPNSRKLVAVRQVKIEERKIWFVESTPKDQFQPKLHSEDYFKPGDPLPKDRPQLFDIAGKKQLPVSDELAPNPFEISNIRWAADSSRFTYLYNQRGHQLLRVISVDAASGEAKTIIEERSPTFIHYSEKLYLEFLDASGELVWMSEHDGWNHLYLFDSRNGKLKNQITKGDWLVRGVEYLDSKKRSIIFKAGCYAKGQDPYHVHYLRINLDGSGLIPLTEGDYFHQANFSPDKSLFLDIRSRIDSPPLSELRRGSDGKKLAAIEKADIAELLKTGWRSPERFVAKGRDGQTDIWGIIMRPSQFDPAKKYPVIEYIYAGPHNNHVPKTFRSFYSPQFLAEAEFIVVQMDGMGTSNRSKVFHDVCWQNLGDSGFPDRILWIKAAAARYPEFDLGKGVGIYGGSAGGQSALRALLACGDFYTAAVADCGCHDNRMDKIWWNEQWLGWPVGPHYKEQSNVTQAFRLKGKLLLTLGEVDHNVDPASTIQVIDALIKADKDFEFFIIPGADHWLLEHPYFKRRLLDFFIRAYK